jgi:predicted nucleic acid-binding protein
VRVFLDTNVFLATILDDAELADESTGLLNRDDLEFVTSSINVMELRAVLCQVRSQVGHVRP